MNTSSHEIYPPELFRINVFVFGSNYAGRHGAGAALWAVRYAGALYGDGKGFQGRSYAIPTKDERLFTLPLDIIANHVDEFCQFVIGNPEKHFFLTPIGCGLANYKPKDIAPMFEPIRDEPNIVFPEVFSRILRP